ncbi:DNA cytosine methyltransferase [Mesorhizobium atlanticum]
MKARSFVDLFSGCGGLSLGLSMAGMQGLFAVEHDPMAFRTFYANFVSKSSNRGHAFEWPTWLDQRAWGIDELLEEHKADLLKLRGKVDVLAGGPPCQGFSFAGRRVEDDPRNQLFQKYVEAVDAIRPRGPHPRERAWDAGRASAFERRRVAGRPRAQEAFLLRQAGRESGWCWL